MSNAKFLRIGEEFTAFVRDTDTSGSRGMSAQLVAWFRKSRPGETFPPGGLKVKKFVQQYCKQLRWYGSIGAERIEYAASPAHSESGDEWGRNTPPVDEDDQTGSKNVAPAAKEAGQVDWGSDAPPMDISAGWWESATAAVQESRQDGSGRATLAVEESGQEGWGRATSVVEESGQNGWGLATSTIEETGQPDRGRTTPAIEEFRQHDGGRATPTVEEFGQDGWGRSSPVVEHGDQNVWGASTPPVVDYSQNSSVRGTSSVEDSYATHVAAIVVPCTAARTLPSVAQALSAVKTSNFVKPPADYQALLDILPEDVVAEIQSGPREIRDGLAELVFDLGSSPHLLYTPADMSALTRAELDVPEVDMYTIDGIVGNIDSPFSEPDDRAGISGTLHRISRRPNRQGDTIGLTIRGGRSDGRLHNLLQAELASGSSILFVGKPGSGKTTLIRDCAAYLAETKRVEIVDTSDEIAGAGNIKHKSVGRARRLTVPDRSKQHNVMLNAVRNHTPQVLVIDEIGSVDEVAAAKDVSQRGVQLLASAHGSKIADILASPVLGKLLGGVHTVILNATEAQARAEHTGLAASRSATERMSAPAFGALVELSRPGCIVVVKDVKEAVDASLAGKPFIVEVRALQGDSVQVQEAIMEADLRS